MFPTEVSLNDASLQKLISTYESAYKRIIRQIEGATSFSVQRKKAILVQIEKILENLGQDVGAFIEKEIPQQYRIGADDAVQQLKKTGAPVAVDSGFNKIHREAVAALVSDTAEAFAESISGVNRSARTLINQAVKDQITEELALGKVAGATVRKIKNNIIGVMRNEGLASLVDKGGRKWTLDRYTEMLIQTKSVEARNTGLTNRMVENGWDLVEVSDHNSDHTGPKGCRQWEGKILSLTGKTKGYTTLQQAKDKGLFHPNCRHAINTLHPELAKISNAYHYRDNPYPADKVHADLQNSSDPDLKKQAASFAPPTGEEKQKEEKPAPVRTVTIKTDTGVLIQQPSSQNPIQQLSEAVRYNAAFQIEGRRSGLGGRISADTSIPENTASLIDKVDVSQAKNPDDAGKIILDSLPDDVRNNKTVKDTIETWVRSMNMVYERDPRFKK